MIEIPNLRELMEAGAHFGHKKERSYPKARQFVYLLKDQVYVIDLEKTQTAIRQVVAYLESVAKEGKTVLFVGTKRQAKEAVAAAANKANMPYVNQRWLGGMLTNFETIKRRLKYLDSLEEKLKSDEAESLTKKERAHLQGEIDKLHQTFDGIRQMKTLPDILFVVDVVKEKIAVAEARKMSILVIGIVDTNANPEQVDLSIPANDDSWKTVGLITDLAAQAITAGQGKVKKEVKPAGNKAQIDETAEEPVKDESATGELVAVKEG